MKLLPMVPAAVLGLGVLLISGMREQRAVLPVASIRSIPNMLSGHLGRELVVPEEERKVAGMSDYSMRAYGPDSAPSFTTYVGYYDRQVQGKSIHSPKNCLPGAGWEIMESKQISLQGRRADQRVNRVLLSNRGVKALVYYWYQGRGRIEANEYKVKWNLLRDAAMYGRTEESLVRIVVPLASSSDAAKIANADSLAADVARVLATEVDRLMPVINGV